MWHFQDEAGRDLLNELRRETGNSDRASGGALFIMSAIPTGQHKSSPLSKYLGVFLSGQSLLFYPTLICLSFP